MEVRIYTVQFRVELEDDEDRSEFESELESYLNDQAVDDIVIDSQPEGES